MPNSTVPAADEGLPNLSRILAKEEFVDIFSSMEGDIGTTMDLLNAAILLLEPLFRDPRLHYEQGAIFAVVAAARSAAHKTKEKWYAACELRPDTRVRT